DVVEDDLARGAVLDVQTPAAVAGENDRVVDDHVVVGRLGSVDLVERNAAGMLVIDQVVAENGVLHAVAVDSGAAVRGRVVVDDVVLDQGPGDDAGAALADVAIHMDAAAGVAEDRVAAHGRVDAAIAHVDAVLLHRVAAGVVFDEDVVGEAGEDAPD